MKKKIFLIIGKRFQILGLEKKINKKGEKKLRTLSAERNQALPYYFLNYLRTYRCDNIFIKKQTSASGVSSTNLQP